MGVHKVGPKGQVVIQKWIRDELGIKPGWEAYQIVRDGAVEIRFYPPPEDDQSLASLAGSLAPYVKHWPENEDDFHELTEWAWAQAVAEKWALLEEDERRAQGEE